MVKETTQSDSDVCRRRHSQPAEGAGDGTVGQRRAQDSRRRHSRTADGAGDGTVSQQRAQETAQSDSGGRRRRHSRTAEVQETAQSDSGGAGDGTASGECSLITHFIK